MSTVPPSPPWPTTRTSSRPFARSAAAMPVATDGALANSEWIHGHLPRGLRVGRREHLQAAGRVGGDQLAVGGAHRGVERVARAERLAAALAGAVAAGDRVACAARVGLHGALLGVEQAVAGREAARLVEADRRRAHAGRSSDRPRGDGADVARACSRRAGPERARGAHALELALDELAVQVEERQRLELARRPRPRTARAARPSVIGRPPRPAITV